MRVLGSEMKLVASSFGKNEQSTQSLTAKNQVLGKEIEAQRSKVETLRAALENSAASFGENDARTKNWQIQLNNAEAALNGLEDELEENTKALDSMGSEADDAGGELKDAAKHTDDLADEVDDLGGEIDDTSGKTRLFGDMLKANLASEAIVAGVKGIGRAIATIGRGFMDAMKDGVDYNARMEQSPQVQAGGVGLNIQAASVAVIAEPQVKPTTEWQAIARAYRMGQITTVQVHKRR